MAHPTTRPPITATLDPDRNEIQVHEGDRLALTLTLPEVRQVVAEIADIMTDVRQRREAFAAIVRGPKGVGR